ncbi:MAG: N-glycosylase/DNA lyase [Candidatus Bilamarchaeum sp.]|jgi:N-glycosylase/DNA lyase
MQSLVDQIQALKSGPVADLVLERVTEFRNVGASTDVDIFKELCFCLLTANYTSHGGIRIQKEINDGFIHLSQEELATKLKSLGHRFPNTRAKYIFQARSLHQSIKSVLSSFSDQRELRSHLAETILGIGYKEASHFLRNIGYLDVAILDFHIIDVLVEHKVIRKPKNLSKKNYLLIEKKLDKLAKATGLTQGELDFYMWYLETGKILK